MTQPNDSRYTDILTGEVSAHLIDDLESAYQPSTPSSRLDAAILSTLREHQTNHPRWKRSWKGWLLRPQAVSVAAACTIVLASMLAYLHGQNPTTVSAQTILNRAATAGLAPNQVTHFSYRLTASNGYTGKSDEWVEADTNGAASRLALSNTVFNGAAPVRGLDERLVQSGDTVQVYDPGSNTVTSLRSDQVDQPWESIVVGTRLAQKLGGGAQSKASSQIVQKGTPSAPSQQALGGVSVYVVHLSSDSSRTLYVDAQSFIPRGADWRVNGVSWQARLLQLNTMSRSAVPAGTFSLDAPATANVTQVQPDKSDYPVDLGDGFAQACNTSPAAFKGAMGSSPDQSMLAVCQQTNPTITSDQLGAALLASAKTQLDAAVAAGSITTAQESDQLARMQSKLDATITSPSEMSTPTPK